MTVCSELLDINGVKEGGWMVMLSNVYILYTDNDTFLPYKINAFLFFFSVKTFVGSAWSFVFSSTSDFDG